MAATSVVFAGDLHLSESPPASRSTGYGEQILAKLGQVLELAKARAAPLVFTGDLFHRRSVHLGYLYEVISLFRQHVDPDGPGVYSIIGNHDVNPKSNRIEGQPLSILFATGLLRYLPATGVAMGSVAVYGRDYQRGAEASYYAVPSDGYDGMYKVVVAHGDLVPRGANYFGRYVEYPDLPPTVALLVNGHIHSGFPLDQVAGMAVVNPGSLARVSRDDQRKDVYVLVLTVADGGQPELEEISLEVVSYRKVFTAKDTLSRDKRVVVDVDKIVAKMEVDGGEVDWESVRMKPQVRELVKLYLDRARAQKEDPEAA